MLKCQMFLSSSLLHTKNVSITAT